MRFVDGVKSGMKMGLKKGGKALRQRGCEDVALTSRYTAREHVSMASARLLSLDIRNRRSLLQRRSLGTVCLREIRALARALEHEEASLCLTTPPGLLSQAETCLLELRYTSF